MILAKKWQAHWIVDPVFYGLSPRNVFRQELANDNNHQHRQELKNRHTLIRKTFYINEEIESAHLDISADDYYKLKINGHAIGQGPAPGYFFHYYYNKYQIEQYLKKGKNVVTVHLYYQGLINRVWNSGDYRQGMIAELFINNKLKIKTDQSWLYKNILAYKSGGITGYQTQFLENIDLNYYPTGWNKINYNDQIWQQAAIKYSDDHKLFLQPTPKLSFYLKNPQKIKELGSGHYLVDFGQIIVGYFKFSAVGKKGEIIEIRHGEELLAGKQVRYQLRSNCKYQEFITLSGKLDRPEFYDYKVFRYVEVIAHDKLSKSLKPESFKALIRHYKFIDQNTTFNSSDQRLNSIWSICKAAVKYGVQSAYLDCPGREKGQYLGDAVITSLSHYYLTGDLRLYKKAIKDFALSSYISAGLMAVAPGSLMQEIADYSLQWPLLLLHYYEFSGDKYFLKEMYPVAEKLLNYFKKFQRSDGLLTDVNEKWNLVDWPVIMRDNYAVNLKQLSENPEYGCHNVINAFFLGMVKTINKIRDILDISYDNNFSKLEKSFLAAFYDKKQKLFTDTEKKNHSAIHSNILPLFFGFAPLEAEAAIVNLVKTKGLKCGVYMAYYLLKALARVGEYKLVYQLIINKSKNSWFNMLTEGATTCWEVWSKTQKENASLLHPWASTPIIVIIEDLLEIDLRVSNQAKALTDNPKLFNYIEQVEFSLQNKFVNIEINKLLNKNKITKHF